jgi:hypothetical protein
MFNVVVAYEDLEAGKQAKKTYDYLVQTLGHVCRFSNQMWKFEVLTIPKVREMATGDLASADIIIISCARANSLPMEMKAWLEECLETHSKAIALVFLYGDHSAPDEQTALTQNCLASTATRADCRFFAQSYCGLPSPSTSTLGTPSMPGVLASLAAATKPEECYPRWGINE